MSMRIAARYGAALAALVCILAGAVHAAAAHGWSWKFTELDAPGASISTPLDVNNRGDVVGYRAATLFDRGRAFLWQNGVMRDLGRELDPPGDVTSVIERITDQGTMMGHVDNVPFLWKDGIVTRLPFNGLAFDINRSETVVGHYYVPANTFEGFDARAYVYRAGVFQDLGTLGGAYSQASGINDAGVIVGASSFAPGSRRSHAFVYENGSMRDLGTLGGTESFALAVNAQGVIIGSAQEPNGRFVAVAWERGVIRRLIDARSNTIAINDRGDILITANLDEGPGTFLYRDGVLTQLEDLPAVRAAGMARLSPTAINDRGWIVGSAYRSSRDSQGSAFLLTPR